MRSHIRPLLALAPLALHAATASGADADSAAPEDLVREPLRIGSLTVYSENDK